MRFMMKVAMPLDKFNQAVLDGSVGEKMGAFSPTQNPRRPTSRPKTASAEEPSSSI